MVAVGSLSAHCKGTRYFIVEKKLYGIMPASVY
jgi:hypothetical protein